MIFTNIDLTATILAFMFKQLAEHPNFQEKLYDEVVAQTVDKGSDLRSYVTRQKTLLHYLLLESIRLEPVICKYSNTPPANARRAQMMCTLTNLRDPVVGYSLPECTAIVKVIGRYKIPAKTPVVFDVRRLNTDALTWGPNSREFMPERFASLSPNKYRHGFLRFGISSKCLGKHMADALLKVVVISVLQLYKIEGIEKVGSAKDGDVAFVRRRGSEHGK